MPIVIVILMLGMPLRALQQRRESGVQLWNNRVHLAHCALDRGSGRV